VAFEINPGIVSVMISHACILSH
jgi:hypothetical protein